MRKLFLLIALILLCSCNSTADKKQKAESKLSTSKQTPDCNVALEFINDYVKHIASESPIAMDTSWIVRNKLLTEHFKNTYTRLLDSAYKAEPGYGLGFDPIMDAQDLPEKGFSIIDCDSTNGYVTVKGIDWTLVLVLRVVQQNGAWLVDGSGVINIPEDKRAKR